ncbi:aldo/keto reductase [Myxococcota bacterium]|nr:aldo/keto reductase [Myxococcota bacterium]
MTETPSASLPTLPFGRTGHASSRLVFGAAALARVSQADADQALAQIRAAGVNHIDTAASYGDSERRLAPFLRRHRQDVFLATKTGERSHAAAREQIRRSLERMGVDRIDLIQLHNLVQEADWQQAFAEDGALRACVEARDEGLVRAIGVTGHGTRVAAMHRRSLERFDFDSVLLPMNPSLLRDARYAEEFEQLLAICAERRVAVQTIKSLARRRWPDGAAPTHDTWYEPLTDAAEIEGAVHWALARPGVFVDTAGDLRLLSAMLRAAASFPAGAPPARSAANADPAWARQTAPLFVRGFTPSA